MKTILCLTLLLAFTYAHLIFKMGKPDGGSKKQKYIVFPGLDADPEEVEEWSTGYTSPFNIIFGPKPYVIGWVGEGPEEVEDEVDEDDGKAGKKQEKNPKVHQSHA